MIQKKFCIVTNFGGQATAKGSTATQLVAWPTAIDRWKFYF